VNTVEYLPLSYSQKGLWFLDQLGGGSAEYNTVEALRLRGTLDVDLLQRAINTIVERHESLRTSFLEIDGDPFQAIHNECRVSLLIEDLTGPIGPQQRKAIQNVLKEEANYRFDLAVLPLFRFRLLRIGHDEHVLVKTIHHIVTDGWSNWVFTNELTNLYEAYSAGKDNPLPALPLQYGDFSVWQKEWLESGQLDEAIKYWKQELAGLIEQFELPMDRARPERQTYVAHSHKACLSPETTAVLKRLTMSSRATVFMTLLSAFSLILSRYSHQNDIAVGTPIANRQDEQLEKLIGFFVNMLVMRVKVDEDDTFLKLIEKVRKTTLNAYSYQDVPFERIVEELQPERRLNASPIFQVLFAMQNAPWVAPKLLDMNIQAIESDELRVGFDLEVHTWEHDNKIWFYWLGSQDLFEPWRIEQMARHTINLIEALVANPDIPFREIAFLGDDERLALLPSRQNSLEILSDPKFIHELFEEQVRRLPSALAVESPHGSYTYEELDSRSNEIANLLVEMGATIEAKVGVFLGRSHEMVACFLGILKAGATYLPLDPDYPAERLSHILRDSNPIAVITTRAILASLKEKPNCSIIFIDQLPIIEQSRRTVCSIHPDNAAYMIYTSGSSGIPKGTVLTHAGLRAAAESWNAAYGLDTQISAVLQLASAGFDVSIGDFVRALCFGKRLVICSQECATSASKLFTFLRDCGVDALECVPPVARNLLDYVEENKLSLSFIKLFILGADVVYPADLERLCAACGPDAQIVNSYGLTECTIDSLFLSYFPSKSDDWKMGNEIPSVRKNGADVSDITISIPIGRPLVNTDVIVLDGNLQPAPLGVMGELYIAGPTIARGYINRASLTSERFVANPYGKPGERMYRTGDLVRYRRNGQIEFIGRADSQVKIRSFRVELGEIEAVLRALPNITDVAVTVGSDPGGEKAIVAYIVDGSSAPFEEAGFKEQLAQTLPPYMIPSALIRVSSLPRNAHGKLDRQFLPSPAFKASNTYVPPRSPEEEYLCAVFAEVLGRDRVGRDDNFFEIGGHSLLAMRIVSRIRKTMGLDLSIRVLFQAPTIARLSAHLKTAAPEFEEFERLPRPAKLPVSYAQGRFWFLDQLGGGSPEYNIVDVTRLRGPLNVPALERAFREILRRHDILRTHFHQTEDELFQVVDAEFPVNFALEDLTSIPEGECEREIQSLIEHELSSVFDLSSGPLLRMRLFCLNQNDHLLIRTVHHIIWDAWSEGIFNKELCALYNSYCLNGPESLPMQKAQYADFAIWQRNCLSNGTLDDAILYWKGQLKDIPSALDLGKDRPRPTQQTFSGATVTADISEDLLASLKTLAKDGQATLFMVLLSAFGLLLSRYSNQEDLVIGSPIANRFDEQLETVIGCFVNMLAFRLRINPELSFVELVDNTRNTCFDAYRFQQVPFEELVAELQPERNPAVPPIFQVIFTMNNTPSEGVSLAGLKAEKIEPNNQQVRYDLTVHAVELGNTLHLTCHYNQDLFDAWRMDQLLRHYVSLLSNVASEPTRRIDAIGLLDGRERSMMLERSWVLGQTIPSLTIPALFEIQVARTPNALALVSEDNRLTYADLNCRADAVAEVLAAHGVNTEDIVGLAMDRSNELIVGALGVLKSGAAYLPLDMRLPKVRLQLMLDDARCKFVLTDEQSAISLPTNARSIVITRDTAPGGSLDRPASRHRGGATASNAAYVLYTSGSSGVPKGVVVEHRQIVNYITGVQEAAAFPVDGNYAMLQPLSVDSSVTMMYVSLTNGGCLHVLSEDIATDATRLNRYFIAQEISCLKIAPSHLAALQIDLDEKTLIPKLLIVGGEESRCDWLRAMARTSPTSSIWNHYGPTETTVGVLMYPLGEMRSSDHGMVPLGKPLANVGAYVLDGNLQLAPVGVVGELYVSGGSIARGYLNQPGLTAQRFVPDPYLGGGARMYRTGDLVRWKSDNNLEFLGRTDDQIKIRGFRIELREVEAALMAQPLVREAVVVVHDDDQLGKQIVGYVVPRAGEELDSMRLRYQLRDVLPEYMIPSTVISLEFLPRTSHGKLDRQALAKPPAEVKPEAREPRSFEEKALCDLFSEILGVDRVGIDDNFFQLGGHSLIAARIVNRIRADFGVELRFRDVFYARSIETLASALAAIRSTPGDNVDRASAAIDEERYL
jgi:amino acid adenylation domain-containing protein